MLGEARRQFGQRGFDESAKFDFAHVARHPLQCTCDPADLRQL
jgi:hypothetical protein